MKGRGETREEVRKGDLLTSLTFQGMGTLGCSEIHIEDTETSLVTSLIGMLKT